MFESPSISLSTAAGTFSALVAGDPGDPLVLCIHGFPDQPSTFRFQAEALAAAGYRVVAPTLRGYEPSTQQADGDYSAISLANDVVDWLDALDVETAHIVGHDWGAVIVHVASSRSPERIRTAATMAVPPVGRIPAALKSVPRQLQRSWYMTFFQLPKIAERALQASDWKLLRQLWSTWSPSYEMSDDEWHTLREQFEAPGVVEAALGYYRRNATPPILLGLKSTEAMEAIDVSVPMLIMNGLDDGCMDKRLFDHTVIESDFSAGVTRLEIEGAGHFMHLEKPDVVNAALLEHFNSATTT